MIRALRGSRPVLVLGAAAVASVLAYIVMKAWLQNFAFRADINPLIFVAAALAGLAIAYATVALQSMKAAPRCRIAPLMMGTSCDLSPEKLRAT